MLCAALAQLAHEVHAHEHRRLVKQCLITSASDPLQTHRATPTRCAQRWCCWGMSSMPITTKRRDECLQTSPPNPLKIMLCAALVQLGHEWHAHEHRTQGIQCLTTNSPDPLQTQNHTTCCPQRWCSWDMSGMAISTEDRECSACKQAHKARYLQAISLPYCMPMPFCIP